MHSISTPLPLLSCKVQVVRAGGSVGKNSRQIRFISSKSLLSASTTVILTMRSKPEPADSSMCAMLHSVCRICSAIGPRLRPPVNRVNRTHAGQEDVVADPNPRRMRQVGVA